MHKNDCGGLGTADEANVTSRDRKTAAVHHSWTQSPQESRG